MPYDPNWMTEEDRLDLSRMQGLMPDSVSGNSVPELQSMNREESAQNVEKSAETFAAEPESQAYERRAQAEHEKKLKSITDSRDELVRGTNALMRTNFPELIPEFLTDEERADVLNGRVDPQTAARASNDRFLLLPENRQGLLDAANRGDPHAQTLLWKASSDEQGRPVAPDPSYANANLAAKKAERLANPEADAAERERRQTYNGWLKTHNEMKAAREQYKQQQIEQGLKNGTLAYAPQQEQYLQRMDAAIAQVQSDPYMPQDRKQRALAELQKKRSAVQPMRVPAHRQPVPIAQQIASRSVQTDAGPMVMDQHGTPMFMRGYKPPVQSEQPIQTQYGNLPPKQALPIHQFYYRQQQDAAEAQRKKEKADYEREMDRKKLQDADMELERKERTHWLNAETTTEEIPDENASPTAKAAGKDKIKVPKHRKKVDGKWVEDHDAKQAAIEKQMKGFYARTNPKNREYTAELEKRYGGIPRKQIEAMQQYAGPRDKQELTDELARRDAGGGIVARPEPVDLDVPSDIPEALLPGLQQLGPEDMQAWLKHAEGGAYSKQEYQKKRKDGNYANYMLFRSWLHATGEDALGLAEQVRSGQYMPKRARNTQYINEMHAADAKQDEIIRRADAGGAAAAPAQAAPVAAPTAQPSPQPPLADKVAEKGPAPQKPAKTEQWVLFQDKNGRFAAYWPEENRIWTLERAGKRATAQEPGSPLFRTKNDVEFDDSSARIAGAIKRNEGSKEDGFYRQLPISTEDVWKMNLPAPRSKREYDELPPGSVYIKDGKPFRKAAVPAPPEATTPEATTPEPYLPFTRGY